MLHAGAFPAVSVMGLGSHVNGAELHLEEARARCTIEYDTADEPTVTAFSCSPH
ncbi:MAG: hypothetical protein IPK80_34410 [Nannocystis sp.]|nr:hypothetical protein [Nannocystis sp.]